QRSGNTVSGTTTVANAAIAGVVDTYAWSCTEGLPCDWRFWVDPVDPTGSAVGPNGETFLNLGNLPFSYGSYSTNDATMIGYSNDQTGVEYRYVFESRTGLVLSYSEIFRTQQTYIYFTSINTDLSTYQPPVTGAQTVPGVDVQTEEDDFETKATCFAPPAALILIAGMAYLRSSKS
ncbi:MAG: hypothetical protein KAT35_03260, partial [Candidatus Aenigmarchaeota archaeon]|nr:hypothetical protein [Candidatus Aenigmarchaeota archaeon]